MTAFSGPTVSFLVGAGRSGTTLLYKLLCLHPDVAYISNFENRATRLPAGWMTRLNPRRSEDKVNAWFRRGGDAYFRRRSLRSRLTPMPVEGKKFLAASGMPLYPRPGEELDLRTIDSLRRKVTRIANAAGASVFVFKRTANNRRIPQLETLFPDARYVHLIRDGRDVTRSLSQVDWWHDHTLWWDGRTPRELEATGADRLGICARNWVEELEILRRSLDSLPGNRRLEVRYETLVTEPQATLCAICRFLGLRQSDEFEAALESVGLSLRNRAWQNEWDDADLANVLSEAAPMLSRLEYL